MRKTEVGSTDSIVTSNRRKKFADALRKRGVTKASQITKDVQIELFDLCESAGERCALRRFLTHDYRMSVELGGILTEKELAEAKAKAPKEQISMEALVTVGALA